MEQLIERFQIRQTPKTKQDFNIYLASLSTPTSGKNEGDKTVNAVQGLQEVDLDSIVVNNTDANANNQKNHVNDEVSDSGNVVVIDQTKQPPKFDYATFRSVTQGNVVPAQMMLQFTRNEREYDNLPAPPSETSPQAEAQAQTQAEAEMPRLPSVQEQGQTEQRKPQKRMTKRIDVTKRPKTEVANVSLNESMKLKLPQKDDMIVMKKPSYYMNNRQVFTQYINKIFAPHREELNKSESTFSCDSLDRSEEFKLLIHQRIVRDYLNIYTPYRGLLLYHGLGSGKTCSSIAISEAYNGLSPIALGEGMTQGQQVVVLVPASLRTNFYEELKKCGNPIFKKNQYWKFVSVSDDTKTMEERLQLAEQLSTALQLPLQFIQDQKGAFMVDTKKETNYDKLSGTDKRLLDKQINAMIEHKYLVLNYNGIRKDKLNELTNNFKTNPFDNKVVIIDEAHNFISRVVNKIGKERQNAKPKFISTQLYDLLMSASNTRIVLLTGTPIINYPNEIGILYNILRGYIKSWRIPYDQKENKKAINFQMVDQIMKTHGLLDYLEVTTNEIIITRNPYMFTNTFYENNYVGVKAKHESAKDIKDDKTFLDKVLRLLQENEVVISKGRVKVEKTKALPDRLDKFQEMFIDSTTGVLKHENIFKRRILGLTSYFRSAQETLMPSYDESNDYYPVKIEMSDYQMSKYEQVRLQEITLEKKSRQRRLKNRTKELYEDATSSYRIFSRAFCNFVFPDEIGRPMPGEDTTITNVVENVTDEDDLDAVGAEQRKQNIDGRHAEDDVDEGEQRTENVNTNRDGDENKGEAILEDKKRRISKNMAEYQQRIQHTLDHLESNSASLLTPEALKIYSPKFLHILETVLDRTYVGSHLLYSQFRTLEGIGIFSLVLQANGFTPFKLKRNAKQEFVLDIPREKRIKKRMFALYTGTETVEEKEALRNIFNGQWETLSTPLQEELREIHGNNMYGEIIKMFMITSSGAEGISLKNVRYVHIMEPYWHPVRKEQVIGRARRICSHDRLPESERNIKVFLYMMTFSESQLKSKLSPKVRKSDISKFGNASEKRPLTSDESLGEIMNIKENISKNLLKAMKEASMDCGIHLKANLEESLECFSFGNVMNSKVFSYRPNIMYEDRDSHIDMKNKKTVDWGAVEKVIDGKRYALRLDENNKPTNMLYDIETFLLAKKHPNVEVTYIGKLVTEGGKTYIDGNV